MSEATTSKACEIIETATKLFGENGENWMKYSYNDANSRFCMVGALVRAADPLGAFPSMVSATHPNFDAYHKACQFVHQAVNETRRVNEVSIPQFNDDKRVTFQGVKRRMERALKLCIEAAKTAPSA